ncbi:DUF58 domain-containing protein [Paenibacillus sp. LHD-117]|uniref:DUF58 domain-containing protein n=1 Tax=Paenibacillus sp. LHD-117 TaxID=3071412 RepID=UPI0027DFD40C|nr:DUF58 domain-containing protein [Paenibacillus sp. LHD-117]MDQ6422572.1 DUF58 domain-containing protein [Paenibacillus sp. LHD-117]
MTAGRADASQVRGSGRDGEKAEHDRSSVHGGVNRYRTRWIAWSLIIVALAGCSAAAVIRGGALEWYAASVLLGITVFSGVMPFAASRGLSAARFLQQEAAVAGDGAEIKVVIERRWRIPFVWVTVEETAENGRVMSPASTMYRAVAIPGTESRTAVTYSIQNLRRGVYGFREMTVTVGDWLGLTAIRRSIAASGELVVWPSMTENVGEAANGSASSERTPGADAASAADAMAAWGESLGDSSRVMQQPVPGWGPESRSYREGDSIRHLDFRAAARGRGLRIKASVPERPRQALLLIDTFAGAYGRNDSRFDACLSRAAFEARQLSDAGVRVTVATASWTFELEEEVYQRDRLHELLGLLANLRPEGDGGANAGTDDWISRAALPAMGSVHVFSGDWQHTGRWLPLSAHAAEQGGKPALHLAMDGNTLTYAMRENQRELEKQGIRVSWLRLAEPGAAWASAGEGADSYAIG